MTTYIPSLTLPSQVFAQPALSILLPVGVGLGLGYFVTRTIFPVIIWICSTLKPISARNDVQSKYNALKQPPFRPPPWVFGPTWTVLYTMIGYSAHRAWTTGSLSLNPQIRELTKVWLRSPSFFEGPGAEVLEHSKVQHFTPFSWASTFYSCHSSSSTCGQLKEQLTSWPSPVLRLTWLTSIPR